MPSGLLFIAILAIWAVILIPRMLRIYDHQSTHRSTRRFRHAMASLGGSRRARRPVDVVMVRRAESTPRAALGIVLDSAVDLHLDHGVDPFLGDEDVVGTEQTRRVTARLAAAKRASARRRRVVLTLAGAVLLCFGLGIAGILPLAVALVPSCLAIGMVVVSRRFARQQTLWREEVRLRAEQRRAAHAVDVLPMAPVVPVRRILDDQGVAVLNGKVRSRSSAQGAGVARGFAGGRGATPAQVRLMEQYRALSATYSDAEEELGLDEYIAGGGNGGREAYRGAPAGHRQLRAVNE